MNIHFLFLAVESYTKIINIDFVNNERYYIEHVYNKR